MSALNRVTWAALVLASVLASLASAQNMPTLTISPAKVTMLVGETRTFRAVGKDGRTRHNVHWSISSAQAELTLHGEEAVVRANRPSSGVVLTADAEGESAEATLEIRSGNLPAGSVLWSVPPIPGCKNKQMVQAVPSASGPDLYVLEQCPQGTLVRALTADGREMWRKIVGGSDNSLSAAVGARPEARSGEPLPLHSTSLCDAISAGMSRDDVLKRVTARNLRLNDRERAGETWEIEEEGSRCTISFDGKTGTVIKKKKTIVTD
jgi:hypothetical protein